MTMFTLNEELKGVEIYFVHVVCGDKDGRIQDNF